MTPPILTRRALNRATLARQMLLDRSEATIVEAIEHLVGLQAQTPQGPYVGLWSRLRGFRPEAVSDLLYDRGLVRLALMRSTIHLVSSRDAWDLRRLVQPVIERMNRGGSGRRLGGVETGDVEARGRAYVAAEPRTFKALGDHLLEQWPDQDRVALEQAIRTAVPLVQVPPRAAWGRSGPAALTSIEAWLGVPPPPRLGLEGLIRRYLGAFGPATVMDAQAWSGLTRLGATFDALRPELVVFRDERGRELFDLPGAARPHPDLPAPPRFLYDFDNLLLSHADRTRVIPAGLDIRAGTRPSEVVSTFLLDGMVAGTWRIERDRGRARLMVRPLVATSKAEAGDIEREAARLLAFLASEAADRDVTMVRPS
jgi:hypothetical protein